MTTTTPASVADNAPYPIADAALIRSAVQRVATGPELSKNLDREEARAVMHAILEGLADPVQAAVYLIGLRMKRETEQELKGTLDALLDRQVSATIDLPDVAIVSDPYNGFNRTAQGSLFVLPVLAACGLPAYSHGARLVGPKYGVTHHTALDALGGQPLAGVDIVCEHLQNPDIGWGYIDQSIFAPELHDLNELRRRIVKRPILSTTEVVLGPIRARNSHLVTGYVHKPYRETYAMLSRHVGYESLLLIRGTEGGIVPSFRGKAHMVRVVGDADAEEIDIDLASMDLERDYRALDIPSDLAKADPSIHPLGTVWDPDALAAFVADAGRRALGGEAGPVQDAAVLGAALVLWHTGRAPSLAAAAAEARSVIASGEALRRLECGLGT